VFASVGEEVFVGDAASTWRPRCLAPGRPTCSSSSRR
jgi:hypothetical protein